MSNGLLLKDIRLVRCSNQVSDSAISWNVHRFVLRGCEMVRCSTISSNVHRFVLRNGVGLTRSWKDEWNFTNLFFFLCCVCMRRLRTKVTCIILHQKHHLLFREVVRAVVAVNELSTTASPWRSRIFRHRHFLEWSGTFLRQQHYVHGWFCRQTSPCRSPLPRDHNLDGGAPQHLSSTPSGRSFGSPLGKKRLVL